MDTRSRPRAALLATLLPLLAITAALAAEPAPTYPDADASDPAKLGWMVGSPPPPDSILRFDDGS